MQHNTKRSPSSMGEQWLPVPVRLVEAIYEAPTPQRRAWAIAYLLIWLVVFHRTRKGSRSSMAEVEAWTLTKSRQRTVKARADALACLEKWTDRGPEVDRKWTRSGPLASARNYRLQIYRTTHLSGLSSKPSEQRPIRRPGRSS